MITKPSKLIAFNKPYGVVSQFSNDSDNNYKSLSEFNIPKGYYPAGRLDADSEGLLLLTNDGLLQAQISSPKFAKIKIYVAQVDGIATNLQMKELMYGVNIGDGYTTKPCMAKLIDEPKWIWDRSPPVRYRLSIPTSWVEIAISEGKNRQVRKMTAKVGIPTLRLIRFSIDTAYLLDLNISPGEFVYI